MASSLPTSSAQPVSSGEHDRQDGQGEVPPGSVKLWSENFVGITQIAAAFRAIESRREDRLLNDIFAERLAGRTAMEICRGERPPEEADASSAIAASPSPSAASEQLRGEEGRRMMKALSDSRVLSVRNRFCDDFFEDCTMLRHIKQVVSLGAGMDTRARRLKAPEDTKVFEVDQAAVLRLKSGLLSAPGLDVGKEEGGGACARVIGVESDVSVVGWQDKLLEAGFDSSSPSAWIMEDLTMVLEDDALKDVLRVVNSLCPLRSALCITFMRKESMLAGRTSFSEELTNMWNFKRHGPAVFIKAQFPKDWYIRSVACGARGEYPDGADYGVGFIDRENVTVIGFS